MCSGLVSGLLITLRASANATARYWLDNADLLDRGHVSNKSGPISIQICCLAPAYCWVGPRRGPIN
jgi:hypothetical protein